VPGQMELRIWDVEHGQCAMLGHTSNGQLGRLAMIDSGCTANWRPSTHIKNALGRTFLDYLLITNADQDHMSDLQGLWDEGISVTTCFKNASLTSADFEAIKLEGGPLSDDARRYAQILSGYTASVPQPFNQYMSGIICTTFGNTYPAFTDTNNLSLVIFIEYAGFKILFPGDLEKEGWLALLADAAFRAKLASTNVLVASHHGRESGFCEEIFDYFTPQAVVISDKPIAHETQLMVPDYRNVTKDSGVIVATTQKRRHVLTTRRDGWIEFIVNDSSYRINTEKAG
jgi:hypothetical protein